MSKSGAGKPLNSYVMMYLRRELRKAEQRYIPLFLACLLAQNIDTPAAWGGVAMAQGESSENPKRVSDKNDDATSNQQNANIRIFSDSEYSSLSVSRLLEKTAESSRLQDANQLGKLSIDQIASTTHDQIYKSPMDTSGPTAESTANGGSERPAQKNTAEQKQEKPGQESGEKQKPSEQRKAIDTTAPFVDISPEQASRLLDTPAGKDLPPVAERFEKDALDKLGPLPAPTIYVSKDSHNADIPRGATTYRSITEAVNNATAGSVIKVMPGTYYESIKLGEKQSNIALITDRDNPAIISGGNIRISSGAHDISIRNFDVRNFSGHDSGIRVDGTNIDNITIAGNNVHDARNAEGIAVYGRSGSGVNNINLIGNRVHDLKLSELEAMPVNGNVQNFKIEGNSGYKLDNLFIDVIGGEGNGGTKDQPRGGEIAFNFADGISSRNNPSYGDYSSAGIYSDAGSYLNIYGNYVRNSDFGVELGSEHSGMNSSHIKLHNNILEKSVSWLKLGYKGGVDNISVKDNLVLNNSLSDIERGGPASSSVQIDGNVRAADRRNVTRIPSIIAAKFY